MKKILLIVLPSLLVYMVLAWFTGSLLGLAGNKIWIFRVALILIGIVAAALLVWFFAQQNKKEAAAENAEEAPAGGGGEIAALLRDAEKKLSAANLEKGARLGNLPAIILLGEPSSTKTTIMLNSGLDPELLAGQVYQEGNVTATRNANLWYSRRTLFVEAGGKLLEDTGSRSYLIRRLMPRQMRGAGQSGIAPRAALVCVEIEKLTGGQQAYATLARNLRARLGEIAEQFGIQLPVYVLFTKTDRLPFFTDYVRNLTKDESTVPLGAALPLTDPHSGVYGEQQSARLGGLFDQIFRGLCNARPELLSRENDSTKLPGAYELPREFRKLRAPITQFLLDVCRPSQLTVGPFLRGFYFSAVRPVIIQEVAPGPEARPEPQSAAAGASDATGIFRAGGGGQAAAPQARRAPISRKVPQWLFLTHFFNDVLLADRAAMGASGASTKANRLLHALLITAAALSLFFLICFTVSFFRNRSLESQLNEAAAATATAPTGANLASLDSLKNLEALRQSVATLTEYKRDGAPLSYRWGLYVGDDLYPGARRLYFNRFRQLLLGPTQNSLVAFLGALPSAPSPAAPYDQTYNSLKAYLITTTNHDKSVREFLSPALMKTWSANQTVDADRQGLAQKQFDFYADELKIENPYSSTADQGAVLRARNYLKQFGNLDRIYQAMKSGAPQTAINFNRQVLNSRPYVVDEYDVPGPFTKDGFKFMRAAISDPSKYVHGETWVLGDQAAVNANPGDLRDALLTRYQHDYISEWKNYLRRGSVVKYKDLADASEKMKMLSGGQSPLLALFALASQNIAWEDAEISKALQPIQLLEPPGAERYIGGKNTDYVGALIKLQGDIDSVVSSPAGTDSPAANQALNDAKEAKNVTNQLAALNFNPDPENLALTLLLEPITNTEARLRGVGADQLNAGGQELCGKFRAVLGKYPFNPAGKVDATVAELNSILHNPEGELWQFYDNSLKKFLTKQGSQYVPAGGGAVTLTPAFVAFFNNAAAFSEALYAGGSNDPHLSYKLTWLPSDGVQGVNLQIDGQVMDYSSSAASKQFDWRGAGTHLQKATVKLGQNVGLGLPDHEGLWSMFRFISEADSRHPQGGGELFEWVVRSGAGGKPMTDSASGKPLVVRLQLDMAGAPAIFEKNFFSRLGCVANVAK